MTKPLKKNRFPRFTLVFAQKIFKTMTELEKSQIKAPGKKSREGLTLHNSFQLKNKSEAT